MNKDNNVQIAPASQSNQSNVAIDVAQQLGNKQPPSNAQVSELLQNTQNFLDQKKNDPSVPPETMKTLSDFKDVLQATDQLNQNKNKDESVQKIITESAQGAKEVNQQGQQVGQQVSNDPSLQGKGQQIGTHAKQLSQSVLQILKLMISSGEFRQQMNSLIGLFQEMFLSEGQSFQQTVQQSQQQGESAQGTAQNLAQNVNSPSEEKKKELSGNFLQIMRHLNENEQFKTGLNNLIDMFQELRDQSNPQTAQMKDAVSSNEHLDTATTESKKLIENFSNQPVDPFINKTQEFFQFVRNDQRARTWFDQFIQLLSDSVKNPHSLDENEFKDRVSNLINDASYLSNEPEFKSRYNDVSGELKSIVDSIRNDEDVQNLQLQTQKFLENFTTVDEQGNRQFNGDLLQQMRTFIVPLLISQLDNIPIPPVQGSNEDMDYFFENMVLSGQDIIPDKVQIKTRGDHTLNVNDLSPEHNGTSAIFLEINDIKPVMNNVHFKFTRKTFPKISDDGVANIQITRNRGISIKISLSLLQKSDQLFQFKVDRVDTDVSKVDIQIVEAKHDFLLKLFSSLYQTRIKRMLEQQISQKIQEAFERIESGLNQLLQKFPPSKVKGAISQGVNKIGQQASNLTSSLSGNNNNSGNNIDQQQSVQQPALQQSVPVQPVVDLNQQSSVKPVSTLEQPSVQQQAFQS